MDWNKLLETILYAVITTGLPILLGYGISYLKSKTNEKLQNIDNTYVRETITEATNIVINCVDTVTQTYVDDLRKVGKFTIEEQKIALEKAISQTRNLLSTETINLISEKYNDLNTWITTTIEAYIKSTK